MEGYMPSKEERLQMAEAGRKFYTLLQKDLEKLHAGKWVAISVMTGSYVVVENPADIEGYAASLQEGDFIFQKRIGTDEPAQCLHY